MQALGYKDFKAARPDEEKMEQFKRALKLTRPAFAATRSPVQQVSYPLGGHAAHAADARLLRKPLCIMWLTQ